MPDTNEPNKGAPTGGPQAPAAPTVHSGMQSTGATADSGPAVSNEPAQPEPTAKDIAEANEDLDDGGATDEGPFSGDEGSPDADDYRDPETGNTRPRPGAFE